MNSYQNTQADTASPAVRWPADTRLAKPSGLAALVVALHPQCPCSLATLHQLETALSECQACPAVDILVYKPRTAPANWGDTSLIAAARKIRGAHLISSDSRAELRRFGLTVSGEVLYYDAPGDLRFRGGLTIARGHEGTSRGTEILTSLLHGASLAREDTAVFGCSLLTSEAEND